MEVVDDGSKHSRANAQHQARERAERQLRLGDKTVWQGHGQSIAGFETGERQALRRVRWW